MQKEGSWIAVLVKNACYTVWLLGVLFVVCRVLRVGGWLVGWVVGRLGGWVLCVFFVLFGLIGSVGFGLWSLVFLCLLMRECANLITAK